MMNQILVGQARDAVIDGNTLNQLFRFRYKVFHERLGWDVRIENNMEQDAYDELNPTYIVAKNRRKEIEACTRLLPTTGPYMLKDTFPQLLCGNEAPADPLIWELSRFAVLPSNHTEYTQAILNSLTFDMLRSLYEFAHQRGIQQYILVTSAALERLLKKTGLPLYRFGNRKTQYVGKVLTVVCWLDINEQFRQAVYKNYTPAVEERVAA